MRVSREKAAANREAIVKAAASLFRENGFNGVGLDEIMARAGLTHGGFYRHFGSKDDLAAEAVSLAAENSARRQSSHSSLEAYLKTYLSPAHRDDPAGGCVFAALGADIARAGQGPRHEVTKSVRAQIDRFANWIAAPRAAMRRRRAIAAMSAAVGALLLARAVDDEALSLEILTETRKAVLS